MKPRRMGKRPGLPRRRKAGPVGPVAPRPFGVQRRVEVVISSREFEMLRRRSGACPAPVRAILDRILAAYVVAASHIIDGDRVVGWP